MDQENRMPLIGDKAPSFEAVTTQGPVKFPGDYAGKWVILFSHPADFTPVCTTEFMTFGSMIDEFKALNTELVGLSVDSIYSPIAWLRKIIYYPLALGRNFDELRRVLVGLQTIDRFHVSLPADWRPGDDVIVPTAGSCGVAKERMDNQSENQYCLDWFMCFRKEAK